MPNQYKYTAGIPCPLGAQFVENGVNFSVFSADATGIELLLFENPTDTAPFQTIKLNPQYNYDYGFWHVFVHNLPSGTHYAYRAEGPRDINQGYRFNPQKVLLDPYCKGVTESLWSRVNAVDDSDNIATSMKSCAINPAGYNWEGITKPRTPLEETIIYEMHVKGFTKSPTSNVQNPGTFLGVIEKIPYLKELGITAVELLPVMHFDETEPNYWGYNTICFFAPHSAYCVSPEEATQLNEFRDMVKELHRNGIEVILDVVYNHTGEGNENGPTINFKGLDNRLYYHLSPYDSKYYMNYSGCGNSFSCNHPVAQKLIIESLEFWATEMQVDGFRFDLGTILTLDSNGQVLEYPPVLWEIELRETLTDCKLIMEPWAADPAARLYQLGNIHGYRWSQWNGDYRNDIKRFVKGEAGLVNEVADKIAGSPDLFQRSRHLPINSINFITCHDGFTLNDLVSYSNDGQLSWNCGMEGATNDPDINRLRLQQIKNFTAILFLSKGEPMILAGDEIRRTQNGNDNGYLLDNETGWINWNFFGENREIFDFFRRMINLRKQTYLLQTNSFYTGTVPESHTRGLKDITWHGTILNRPGWDDPFARTLAFTIAGIAPEDIPPEEGHKNPNIFVDRDIHVMMNMYWEPLIFEIPQINGRSWYRYADTSETQNTEELRHTENTYTVSPRSVAVLVSR